MLATTTLTPYEHQVSGHSSLMTTDDRDVILKPLIPHELNFYRNMAPEIRPFTPDFRGVTEVVYKDVNGDVVCVADLPSRKTYLNCCLKQNKHLCKGKRKVEYEGLNRTQFDDNLGFQWNPWTNDKDPQAAKSWRGRNPWAERVQKHALKTIGQHGKPIPYILLENVSAKFRHPCILDVKIGTRLHGDDCPVDKVQRHCEKNELTTTSKLGLRLTGLQVFQDDRYICRDKFFGRGLSVDGFYSALALFLHDGCNIRTTVISPIVHLIDRLTTVVSSLDSYRLYGSSLVVVYEGDAAEDMETVGSKHAARARKSGAKDGKKMSGNVDGNAANHSSGEHDRQSKSRSQSRAVLGNGELASHWRAEKRRGASEQCESRDLNDNITSQPIHLQSACDSVVCADESDVPTTNCHKLPQSVNFPLKSKPPLGSLVDVRIVDFAHSTFGKLAGNQAQHIGCDSGFMFGLKNLRKMLVKLQREVEVNDFEMP